MKDWIKNHITRELLIKMLMLFIIVQPILDIYILFDPKVVSFFHFSPSTIIRMMGLGIILLMAIYVTKLGKKLWWYILYLGLVAVYVVLHHMNATNFVSNVPGNFNYTIVSELFYVIRMLMPLAIIFITYHVEITAHRLEKVITWLVVLVSGSIVVTNVLGIALGSYTNMQISGTIFDWFRGASETLGFMELSSKGFFTFANSIAALELLITPIVIYQFIKNYNFKNIALLFIQFLAMFILGTKVATLGFIGILAVSIVIYLFFCFIKKEFKFDFKILNVFAILIVALSILLPFSPTLNRFETDNKRDKQNNNIKLKCMECTNKETYNQKLDRTVKSISCKQKTVKVKNKDKDKKVCNSMEDTVGMKLQLVDEQLQGLSEEDQKEFLIEFIKKEYQYTSIYRTFITESLPYQHDPIFWYGIMKQPLMQRTDFRNIETAMLKRVIEVNNNPNDKLFGITYTRMSNIFNLERDFISHYYTLGITGLILFLGPYVAIIFFCGIKMLISYKEKFTFKNVMFILSSLIMLGAAIYSGNVMDQLIVTLIFGFILGILIRDTTKKTDKKTDEDELFSIVIPTYNDCESMTETLDSVREQTYKNWELIIVDDGSTDKTKEVIKKYKKEFDPENKIHYFYQENRDQLRAIVNALDHVSGAYIHVLHSDDLLASSNCLEQAVEYFHNNPTIDVLISDLLIINDKSEVTGLQRVRDYTKSKFIPPLQLLWLGRNLFVDVNISRTEVYKKYVKENYLEWNCPFWLCMNDKVDMLNVANVDFHFMKYRIYDGNYINNEIGKLNVINGELRAAIRLMNYYHIPHYKAQYTVFRTLNKLGLTYYPFYQNKKTMNKAEIIKFIIEKRFDNYKDNLFLDSLLSFYINKSDRTVKFKLPTDEIIYKGSDMRTFNKCLLDNKLSPFHKKLLKEMKKGFGVVEVTGQKEYNEMVKVMKFFCIYDEVEIKIGE